MEIERTALTIGRLASAAGVGVETIRFYEREGLLPKPPRKRSGYRQYPPHAVARVLFIRRAKELGFTLKEISELLQLRVDPDKSCVDVRADIACPSCEVSILDMKDPSVAQRAKDLGITRVPAVVVNGKLADCCAGAGPTEAGLRAAGVGSVA